MSCAQAGKSNQNLSVVVGAIYNLSGSQSSLDIPSLKGAELAVQKVNSQGGVLGRQVKLVVKDGQSNTITVKERTLDLIKKHPDLTAIIGLSDTDMVLASAPEAAQNKKVFMTSGATSPKLPGQIPEYLFLACFGDNVQAAAAAEWAYNDLSAHRASVLFNSTETYTRLLKGYFETRFKQLGGEIVSSQAFTSTDLDSLDLVLTKTDIIFLSAQPPDVIKAITILRKSGFAGPILGGDGFDVGDSWGEHTEVSNVFFTTHAYLGADNPDPAVRYFITQYIKAYDGNKPTAFSALGYDAANLIVTAISNANSSDPDMVRMSLATIRNFKGVTGTISYSPDSRIPKKSVSIIKVDKGSLSLEKELLPDKIPAP